MGEFDFSVKLGGTQGTGRATNHSISKGDDNRFYRFLSETIQGLLNGSITSGSEPPTSGPNAVVGINNNGLSKLS